MGVQAFAVDKPLAKDSPLLLLTDPVRPRGGIVSNVETPTAWAIDARSNAVAQAIQELHERDVSVYRAREEVPDTDVRAGDALVAVDAITEAALGEILARSGATARGVAMPKGTAVWSQSRPRLGIFKPWTACIDEGWARWVLEEYGYPYVSLTPADIRQGNLRARIDVLLIPEMSAEDVVDGRPEKTRDKDPIPPEYVGGLGEVGMEALRRFAAAGGHLIAIDRAAGAMIDGLALPVERPLRDVSTDQFSCPGSLLRIVVDTTHQLGYGLPRETAVLFMDSVVFGGTDSDACIVGRYPRSNPRLSGWINGWPMIEGKGALLDVRYGHGRVVLVGFRPYFRAQARGTYRILFNAIDRAGQTAATFPAS